MIFLVFTRNGYEQIAASFGRSPSPLWVGPNVFSVGEIAALRDQGVDLTNFTYEIRVDDISTVNGYIETIRMHHPDETIYCEFPPRVNRDEDS